MRAYGRSTSNGVSPYTSSFGGVPVLLSSPVMILLYQYLKREQSAKEGDGDACNSGCHDPAKHGVLLTDLPLRIGAARCTRAAMPVQVATIVGPPRVGRTVSPPSRRSRTRVSGYNHGVAHAQRDAVEVQRVSRAGASCPTRDAIAATISDQNSDCLTVTSHRVSPEYRGKPSRWCCISLVVGSSAGRCSRR